MILHLVSDEKFIDYAIKMFGEVAPLQNVFLAVVPCQGYQFRYIKQIEKLNTVIDSDAGVTDFVNKSTQYDAIMFHSLFPEFFCNVLDKIDNDTTKIAWMFWGGEFYEHPSVGMNYQGQLTYSSYQRSIFVRKYLANLKNVLVKKKIPDYVNNIGKITHIITPFPEDYKVVRDIWHCNAQWIWWNYYSIEETLGNLVNMEIVGDDILLGNSATLPNNHIEILSILQKINLGRRKVFIPLSYGNSRYAKFVTKKAKKCLNVHSVPLLDFLERDEYNKIMLNCGVVIMNHYRQQAVGNIVTALWLGAKIYMSERSPVYRHFIDLGAKIYTVEKDLKPDNPESLSPLTNQEKENNREVIYKEYSKKNMLEKTQLLVNQLLAH